MQNSSVTIPDKHLTRDKPIHFPRMYNIGIVLDEKARGDDALQIKRNVAATIGATRCSFPFCTNGANCGKWLCSGCPFNCYQSEENTCPNQSKYCAFHCTPEDGGLEECSKCVFFKPTKVCDLGTFRDVTKSVFSGEDSNYWNEWMMPGKPMKHFASATMVDVDGDSVLDFFTPMHDGNLKRYGPSDRNQLGLTVFDNTNMAEPMHLRDASSRIIIEDPWQEENHYAGKTDKHGELIVDLDNDGILDIFILSGGNRGNRMKNPASRDNFLLFGEMGIDEDTGEEITLFRGGRVQALAAGLHGRMDRGRSPYLLGGSI